MTCRFLVIWVVKETFEPHQQISISLIAPLSKLPTFLLITSMTTPLPPGLTLTERETEVLSGRQLRAFNALPDNPSKLIYIRATMDANEKDRQKSVCLE